MKKNVDSLDDALIIFKLVMVKGIKRKCHYIL